jgi:hypothetical protein
MAICHHFAMIVMDDRTYATGPSKAHPSPEPIRFDGAASRVSSNFNALTRNLCRQSPHGQVIVGVRCPARHRLLYFSTSGKGSNKALISASPNLPNASVSSDKTPAANSAFLSARPGFFPRCCPPPPACRRTPAWSGRGGGRGRWPGFPPPGSTRGRNGSRCRQRRRNDAAFASRWHRASYRP